MSDSQPALPNDPVRFIESDFRAAVPGERADPEEGPVLLHHYTSGQGLFGILNSGEVHCTNVLYMNDASEMDYGRGLTANLLEDAAERISEPVKRRLPAIRRGLEMPDFQYFVSCYCEKADLLSQWRAYGAQSAGYCIGFAAEDLRKVLPEYAELVRVIYNPQEQEKALRRAFRHYVGTAERCCTAYPEHARLEEALDRWAAATSNYLGRLIARMKSPAFEEEREWRVIIIRFTFDQARVRFRVSPGGVFVPYFPFFFKKDGVKSVRELRHGPTVNPTLAVRSMGELLNHLGYSDVHLKGSAIPLRA
ncbi:MAG TPA: DUF2971 domain-containing protein [Bryobacteraceae bacterium]|nr:DUF2971 domain-containing protein [Bryobacteraceae bacterium]